MKRIKNWLDLSLRFGKGFENKLAKIQQWEQLPADRLRSIANEKVEKLLSKARKSEFYAPLFQHLDTTLEPLEQLRQLPELTKQQVRANGDNLKISRWVTKNHSSGSSGVPLAVYRNLSSIQWENAYVWHYRLKNGFHPGDRTLWIRGDVTQQEHYRYDKSSGTLKLSYYNLNETTFSDYYKCIIAHKAQVLVAYPSAAYRLALLCEKNGVNIALPKIFTSSELLLPHQREKIETVFQGRVFDWYGNAERCGAFYLENGVYKAPPLYSILNFKEDSFTATNLFNRAFPLLNYYLEDVLEPTTYSQFLKEEVFINQGRNDAFVELRDGTKISNFGVLFGFDSPAESVQWVQGNGTLELRVVPKLGAEQFALAAMQTRVDQMWGQREEIKVRVITAQDLQLTSRGKLKLVVKE